MWDAHPKELQKAVEAALGPEAAEYEIRFQPMFGGIMSYTYERPFASLSVAGIALKLSAEDRERLIEAGGYPLRYKESDPPSKSYTVIPKDLVESGGEPLKTWLITSMTHVKTLPMRKKKKK
ncbi:MAG: TfoX/Sxy family protein [Sphingomonadales bacterium]